MINIFQKVPPGPPSTARQGFALPFVMGVVAVAVPLLLLYSMMSGSQTKEAVHFHERLTTETIAWSGIQAGIGRLQGDGAGQFFSGTLSGGNYAVSIQPLGTGMASQSIFHIFSSAQRGKYTYTFVVKCEQFPRDPAAPSVPNLVLPRDFWGTTEAYDISQAFDCNALVNLAGADSLAWFASVEGELSCNNPTYTGYFQSKASALPAELQPIWNDVVNALVAERAGAVTN